MFLKLTKQTIKSMKLTKQTIKLMKLTKSKTFKFNLYLLKF